jgi:acyl-CoA reductase-like NAD-dependent aldehyde dehydrogenase
MANTTQTADKSYVLSDKTRQFLSGPPKRLLIGGNWVEPASGETFRAVNPATEETLAYVAQAGASDVDAAVAAARRVFDSGAWSRANPHARSRTLVRIAELIEADAAHLAELIVLDNGKTLREARKEVQNVVDSYLYYAGWPTKIYGETNPSSDDVFNYTLVEPAGVCVAIVPWNAPLLGGSMEAGPALACGNSFILKPGEQASLASVRLGELMLEAGLPPGVFTLLTGEGSVTGAALAEHPDVDTVAFTGSTEVGKRVLAASVGSLKRVHLELGGKSPVLVLGDADLDLAIRDSAKGIFALQGQVCCATSRAFVHRSVYDEFVAGMVEAADAVRLGQPLDEETTMGPLITGVQRDRVCGYIEAGKREGAVARAGGDTAKNGPGYFVPPTIFADAHNGMTISQEEIFGPVLTVIPFDDLEDAVGQGNGTIYGLAAAVYTQDISRANALVKRLRAGTVWVNNTLTLDMIAPFGGTKQSGFGRKRGKQSIEHYTSLKTVFVRF